MTLTVPGFAVSRRLGLSGALATAWDICKQPPSLDRLDIWSIGTGLSVSMTTITWLLNSYIGLAMSISSGACALTIEESWLGGITLSCSQFWLPFDTGYTTRLRMGGSVSIVVVFCLFLCLPSSRILRMSSSVITKGRLLSDLWRPWNSPSLGLWNSSSSRRKARWGMIVVIPVWFIGAAALLLHFQAASDVVLTIIAFFSLLLDAPLTLQLPICGIVALQEPTALHYVQVTVGFRTPFPMVMFIGCLSTRSIRISAPPVTKLPLLRFTLPVPCSIDESDGGIIADEIACLGLPLRSDEVTPCVPPATPGVIVDVLHVEVDGEGAWYLSDVPLSGFIYVCSVSEGTYCSFKRTARSFRLTVRLTRGKYFD